MMERKWYYLTVKNFLYYLEKSTSNHIGDFYCLNSFHTIRTKDKSKKHEILCRDHDYCCIQMQNENIKISKYNHREKCMRNPFVIYAD